MAQRARLAKLRNAFIKASKNVEIAKTATERNAALKAAKNVQKELNALKAAARDIKITELRKLINGLSESNLSENQQKNKLASARNVLGSPASNMKNINASINQLKVVTIATRVRKNAAANTAAANKAAANKAAVEENARKKAAAEENARKKALKNKFGTNNYNFIKFKNANANVVNRYVKLIALRRNFMNAEDANSLLNSKEPLMNATQLNDMVLKTQKNRREALGIPIIVGVFNPGMEKTTNHKDMNFANGSIKLTTKQNSLNMNNIIEKKIPSLGDIFSTESNSNNVGIILMGSSGSGKTYFANNLLKGYLVEKGYTPLKKKMYYGGAYVNGRFVQEKDETGNGATIFNTGIKGASHCAPTPFNPESSRAQEITTYQYGGNGRKIHVIDMAGNEDIMNLYTAYSKDGSVFNLTRLLSNITEVKGTPVLNLGGTLPVIDIAIKYKANLIEISNDGRYKNSIPKHIYELNKNVTLTTGMKTDRTDSGFKQMIAKRNDKYKKDLNRAINSLAYITARCSEGVYITSTMRALIQYLKIYREKRNRKEAMNIATGSGSITNSGRVNMDEIMKMMFSIRNKGSLQAAKKIQSNGGVMRIKAIVNSVQSGDPYSLSRSNEFLEEVATYDNTVLFPLLFSGQNSSKLALATQTYTQMKNLAQQKINRNKK